MGESTTSSPADRRRAHRRTRATNGSGRLPSRGAHQVLITSPPSLLRDDHPQLVGKTAEPQRAIRFARVRVDQDRLRPRMSGPPPSGRPRPSDTYPSAAFSSSVPFQRTGCALGRCKRPRALAFTPLSASRKSSTAHPLVSSAVLQRAGTPGRRRPPASSTAAGVFRVSGVSRAAV